MKTSLRKNPFEKRPGTGDRAGRASSATRRRRCGRLGITIVSACLALLLAAGCATTEPESMPAPDPGGLGTEIGDYLEWNGNDRVLEWKDYVITYDLRGERDYVDGMYVMRMLAESYGYSYDTMFYYIQLDSKHSNDHHLDLTVMEVEEGRIDAVGSFAFFFDARLDEAELSEVLLRSELSRKYELVPEQTLYSRESPAIVLSELEREWIPEKGSLMSNDYITSEGKHYYFYSSGAMEGMLNLPDNDPSRAEAVMSELFTSELIGAVFDDFAASYDPANDSLLPISWDSGRDAVENWETDLRKAFSGEKDVVYQGYRNNPAGGERVKKTAGAEVLQDFAFHGGRLIRMAESRTYADGETAHRAFLDAANEFILAYGWYEGDPATGEMRWPRPEVILKETDATLMIARIREGLDAAARAEADDLAFE